MNDVIVKQVAGSMALSGMVLSQEEREGILRLLEHPEEKEALLQAQIEKHGKGNGYEKMSDYN